MKRILALLAATLVFSLPTHALKVKNVQVEDSLKTEGQTLVLNGAGMRTKFFVDAYVAALYLPEKSSDANAIINGDQIVAVRLHINSGLIDAKRMSESTRDGFVKSTGGNIAPIEKEMEEMIEAFKEEVKDGDIFDMIYVPGVGVKVYRNGEQKTTVAGKPFKAAMLGIWLSENNIQKSLQKAMLNK